MIVIAVVCARACMGARVTRNCTAGAKSAFFAMIYHFKSCFKCLRVAGFSIGVEIGDVLLTVFLVLRRGFGQHSRVARAGVCSAGRSIRIITESEIPTCEKK